ncbi:hypothetical protein KCP76_12520 [Salmonella enterica subsp. enterica serovar Weltevreden]|nr:hypothetical protein KCP76_12520 [Salmonella enterica subsp. enterica serovar Weltevreden]
MILGIKIRDTFPLIFYRDNCADMALTPEDIAKITSLLRACSRHRYPSFSLYSARRRFLKRWVCAKHGLRRRLDVDYRPVLWGLTSRTVKEHVSSPHHGVTEQLQQVTAPFRSIVGTEGRIPYRRRQCRLRGRPCGASVRMTRAVLVCQTRRAGRSGL